MAETGPDTCFVMSAFGGVHDSYRRKIFQPAIEAAGLIARNADDLYGPSAIVRDIWKFISECRVGLADLTDRNPNVLYELGLAHAITKPVVLVTRSIDDVPFDLRGLRVIAFDVEQPDWSEDLRKRISTALTEVLADPTAYIPTPFLTRPRDARIEISETEARQIAIEQQVLAIAAKVEQLSTPTTSSLRSMSVAASPTPIKLQVTQGMFRLYKGELAAHIDRTLEGGFQWSVEHVKDKVVIDDGMTNSLEEAQRLADKTANAPATSDWSLTPISSPRRAEDRRKR